MNRHHVNEDDKQAASWIHMMELYSLFQPYRSPTVEDDVVSA